MRSRRKTIWKDQIISEQCDLIDLHSNDMSPSDFDVILDANHLSPSEFRLEPANAVITIGHLKNIPRACQPPSYGYARISCSTEPIRYTSATFEAPINLFARLAGGRPSSSSG